MENTYTRKKTRDDLYLIYDPQGKQLLTHCDNPFPSLSDNCSENLCQDLNDVNEKNRQMIVAEESGIESGFKLLMSEGLGNELRESFCFCLVSTMTEANGYDFPIESVDLQQDYFLNHLDDLSSFPFEMKKMLIGYLEENEEEAFGKVGNSIPVEIMKEYVVWLVQNMEPYQRCTVQILYHYFDLFSFSMAVLWVKGAIREQHLVSSYWISEHGKNPENLKGSEAYEAPRFLMNRMLYLKTFMYSYYWGDATLPA